jgi:hypothetical protein
LKTLLYYFENAGYFEDIHGEFLKTLRNVRNKLAHPKEAFGAGLAMIKFCSHCVDIINDTYEDRSLRAQRANEQSILNDRILRLVQKGAVLNANDTFCQVFAAEVYFIDNKLKDKNYQCYFKKIENSAMEGIMISIEYLSAQSIDIADDGCWVTFKQRDGNSLVLSTIAGKFENITIEQNKSCASLQEFFGINAKIENEIGKKWLMARREFHLAGEK